MMIKWTALVVAVWATLQMAPSSDGASTRIERHPAVGVHSSGYRLGVLSKCSVKGTVFHSLECELNLGKDSSQAWAFSGSPDDYGRVAAFYGKPVYVQYEQARVKNPNRDTEYSLIDIQEINPELLGAAAFEIVKPEDLLEYSSGVRFGRIVKVSYKGTMVKSVELTMQLGSGGTRFMHLSAEDEMYDHLVKAVKSGRTVMAYYEQSRVKGAIKDTPYEVYKIVQEQTRWP